MQRTYRVGIIGHTGRGNYGHGLDRVWLDVPGCQVMAVADPDKNGLAQAMRRTGARRAYRDYRQMLEREKLDIVAVAPRWIDQHCQMVVAAAERGCHIYLEKPMCRTLEEADRMVAACEKHHVKLAIAHQTRYSPKLPVVKELLASGRLGRVLEFRGRGKEDHRGGGEDLWVLGTHIMDLIRALGGRPRWCMARVTQQGHDVTARDVAPGNEGIGPLAGDNVTAMYALEDGATAYFASRRRAAGKPSRFGLTIYGTAGVLELHTGYLPAVKLLPDSSWTPGRTGRRWLDVSSRGVGKPETLEDRGLHGGNVLAVKDLIRAIETDTQPESNIYEARAATEMIVAVFESHRLRAPAAFPLQNRKNPLEMLPQ